MSQSIASTLNTSYAPSTVAVAMGSPGSTFSIDPLMLAHLDFGLFRSLSRLGTSRARICAVLSLTPAEFDYVEQLRLLTEGAISG